MHIVETFKEKNTIISVLLKYAHGLSKRATEHSEEPLFVQYVRYVISLYSFYCCPGNTTRTMFHFSLQNI